MTLLVVPTVQPSATNTFIPCGQTAGDVDPARINKDAEVYITTTTPPYKLCLRQKQLLDREVAMKGRWKDCDVLRDLMPAEKANTRQTLFVDVGANIGSCSMMMASLGHRVISFEPTPPTFIALSAALAANAPNPSWDVRLVNAGVSNASGAANIVTQPGNAGGALTTGVRGSSDNSSRKSGLHESAYRPEYRRFAITDDWQSYRIWLTTLDEAVHEHVDLMKMDCQGHELRALLGARKLLSGPGVQVIKFEFYPPGIRQVGDDPMALLRFFDEAGYDLYHGNKILPPASFSTFYHQVSGTKAGFTDIVARWRDRSKGPYVHRA